MYRVGFGDCFLLSFDYARPLVDGCRDRHVLIDCGTTKADPHGPKLLEVARRVVEDTQGHLDALVITHRHKDHLHAWADDATFEVLAELRPRLVMRPWTDDPNAPIDATGPTFAVLDERSRRYAQGLRAGQLAAGKIGQALTEQGSLDRRSLRGELGAMALDQVANLRAVERVDAYAKQADCQVEYLAHGSESSFNDVVPGVSVDVLGPPTVDMWPNVTRQRSEDEDEFWMLADRIAAPVLTAVGADSAEPDTWRTLLGDQQIGPARWLLERLESQETASLLRIVRSFDDALNNTSLILLFRVGSRRLLFGGDAQIENWEYCLQHAPNAAAIRRKLAQVDLYKVGHHGSRNATPKSLFTLWDDDRPRTALMSTLPNVHGKRTATAVPRASLVTALRDRFTLHATNQLDPGATSLHVSASTAKDGVFARIP